MLSVPVSFKRTFYAGFAIAAISIPLTSLAATVQVQEQQQVNVGWVKDNTDKLFGKESLAIAQKTDNSNISSDRSWYAQIPWYVWLAGFSGVGALVVISIARSRRKSGSSTSPSSSNSSSSWSSNSDRYNNNHYNSSRDNYPAGGRYDTNNDTSSNHLDSSYNSNNDASSYDSNNSGSYDNNSNNSYDSSTDNSGIGGGLSSSLSSDSSSYDSSTDNSGVGGDLSSSLSSDSSSSSSDSSSSSSSSSDSSSSWSSDSSSSWSSSSDSSSSWSSD